MSLRKRRTSADQKKNQGRKRRETADLADIGLHVHMDSGSPSDGPDCDN